MTKKYPIYDTESARNITVTQLVQILNNLGCEKVIYKKLAPNDNYKNQPYFGSHLTDLPFLPTNKIIATKTTSKKKGTDNFSTKFTAEFSLVWVDATGNQYLAPNAKLIYYPQYPEVRFSGFLLGSSVDCKKWMDPKRQGRTEGRVLVLGISQVQKRTFAFLATPDSRISNEIDSVPSFELTKIFQELRIFEKTEHLSPREQLLTQLREIHLKGWIDSKKLDKNGFAIPYTAQNGGGYTLEAELGIKPNGDALPDFMGWEVKQFASKNFLKAFSLSKALTLFTPEPTGGVYAEIGAGEFVKKYGIQSHSDSGRFDFTGRHFYGERQIKTGLTLNLTGFDSMKKILTDSTGGIILLDDRENIVAEWNYSKIIERWKVKHTQAVYVPSDKKGQKPSIQYHYSHLIRLYNTTNINMLLNALTLGSVYYDPGINVKNVFLKPKAHARSQFRIKIKDLDKLYVNRENVNLLD